ncbi:uncharacterized protein LOC135845746 isoform X2 [Planococcus citri]
MSDDYKYFSIESIFHWKPTLKRENLHEFEFEPQKDNDFNFFNFAIRQVKCYHIHEDDLNSALDIISDLETEALNWSKNKKEDLFAKIKEAYIHLIFASKMYLLKKNPQQVSKIIGKITPIDDMDKFNKAAIYATRSLVLILCSNEGIEKSIVYIDKALNLDAENAQWISLKALYLRKHRESINPIEPPSMMEKELFESAYKKEPTNIVYKLQVADMYVELSEHILKQSSDQYDYVFPNNISLNDHTRFEADSKIGKAVEYYEGAAKKYPEESYVLFCCARGFIRLPSQHQNIKLARTLLHEGLKKNPKSIKGHLTMALILEQYDENIEKAKWHLEICQKLDSFDADLVMIRILHKTEDLASSGFKALQALAEKYTEKLKLAVIYSQMVSFYLFIKYDLIKACHYTEKFYQLNSASTCMKIHRSIFLDYPTPFCLIDVLMDEIKYKKRTPRSPDSIRQICEDFEIFMCYQNVPMKNGFPLNLRWKILQGKSISSNSNFKNENNNYDRNTNSRGEPKRYDTNGDQLNYRYSNGNRLRRAESMSEFPRAFENNKSQNGNRFSYQEQKKRNSEDNYGNHFSNENGSNQRSRWSSNEPIRESNRNSPVNSSKCDTWSRNEPIRESNKNSPVKSSICETWSRNEPIRESNRNSPVKSSRYDKPSIQPDVLSARATPSCESLVEKSLPTEKIEKNSKKEKSPEPDKRLKESSRAQSSESINSEDEKLVKMILKSLKKIKSVRGKKSKKSSKRHESSSSSESESSSNARITKEVERAGKRSSRRKEYRSESDSQSSDRGKKDHHKEYSSRKKYHAHVDSDYSFAEMKKVKGKRRDSPRSEREKVRNEYDSRDKQIEKKSSKYEARSEYSSHNEDESRADSRNPQKNKRSSSRYH